MLTRKVPWTRQPQGVVGVDWSNPLSRGLVEQWAFSSSFGSLGTPYTRVGSITRSVGSLGVAEKGAYQNSYNYLRVERGAFTYTDQVTFEALIVVNAFQTTNFPYLTGVIGQAQSDATGATAYPGPTLRFGDATVGNAGKAYFSVTISGTEYAVSATAVSPVNTPIHLLGTYDGASLKVFVNGVKYSSARTGAFTNHASNWISLLSDYTGWTTDTHKRCLNGQMFMARVFRTGKTDEEAFALYRNPWQLFTTQRLYIPTAAAAASGAPTLSDLRAVSITSSGAQATVDYAF